MEPRKQAILDALGAFVRQRAGLEFGNYGDVKAYRAEQRSITKGLHHYREFAAYVAMRDTITAEMLLEASRSAYSGRLTFTFTPAGKFVGGVFLPSPVPNDPDKIGVEYCTGQYFPTEYRRAACAVLASAIWYWMRETCLVAAELREELRAPGNTMLRERAWKFGREWLSAGDWLRANARREFGRHIASRWFD